MHVWTKVHTTKLPMLSAALLLAFAITAAVTDLVQHKIYNWTTYPGMAAGLLLNGWERGWEGFEDGVKGFVACGLVMLVCFVLFSVGGGDVKLIAMLGAFLGLERGIEAMLWTFVLGGIAGLAALIWRVGCVTLVKKTVRHLFLTLRVAGWLPLTEEERQQLQPPLYLAPAAVAAVAIVLFDLTRLW